MPSKKTLKICSFVIAFLLVVTLATPFLIKAELKNQLRDLGAEEASIESLYLNIWTGYLKIEGLKATAAEKQPLLLNLIEADVSYLDLWKKRIHLDLLSVNGLKFDINIGEQITVGPLLIPQSTDTETEETSDSTPWGWGITRLALNEIAVDSQYQQQTTSLQLDTLDLTLLQNWLPDQNSHLELKGQLNGSPFAIDTRGNPLAETAGIDLALNIEKLQLGPLLKPWAPELSGELSTALTLDIEHQSNSITLKQKGNIALNDFSYALDDLSIKHQSLKWSGAIDTGLASDLLKSVTTDGSLSVAGFSLNQGELGFSNDTLNWEGKNQLQFTDQAPTQINTNGKLGLKGIQLTQAELGVKTDDVSWEGDNAVTMNKEGKLEINNNGALDLANVSVDQAPLKLNQKQVSWKGDNTIKISPESLIEIANNGALKLSELSLAQDNLKISHNTMSWQGKNVVAINESGINSISNNGELSLEGLSLSQPDLSMTNQTMNWKGDIKTDAKNQVAAEGVLKDSALTLNLPNMHVNNSTIAWTGAAVFNLKKAELTTLSGDATVNGVRLSATDKTELATVNAIKLSTLGTQGDNQVTVKTLLIDKIHLTQDKPLLDLASLSIDGLEAGPLRTLINTLSIGKLETAVILDKEGKPSSWTNWVSALSGNQENGTAKSEKKSETKTATDDKTAYHFALKKLQLQTPAKITFSDESVNSRNIDINIDKLTANKIDTQSKAPGDFAIAGKIDRFGQLTLDGSYAWMDTSANGSWKGKLSNLELPPLSPYMQRYSGYQIRSGQLSLDTSGSIKADTVDSNNIIHMQNVAVKKANKEEAQAFDKQMGLPLQTALSIITDEDNNVELKIPVNGSLDDPQFGYQSVINIVMGKIAKEGALSYLTASLQPYGALISLGKMMVDSANAINLEPVKFTAGSSTLDTTASDYLTKITDLLKKKDSLRLNICGVATSSDQNAYIAEQLNLPVEALTPEQVAAFDKQALPRWLNELAEQRSGNVKQELLNQDGITEDRLFNCLPEVDLKSERGPRVNLGF